MVPDPIGADAYILLRDGLVSLDVMAIGKVVMLGKEKAIAIVAMDTGLVLFTLNKPEQVKDSEPFFDAVNAAPDPRLLPVMKKLIASKTTEFLDEEDFDDRYETALLKGIKNKIAGGPTATVEEETAAPTAAADLMSALMGSLTFEEEE